MEKIILDSGEGKTTKIIERANKYYGYIVCLNREEATRIFKLAKKNKKEINFPITFSEFDDGNYSESGCKCFHIDNADLLLRYISKIPIYTISLNK